MLEAYPLDEEEPLIDLDVLSRCLAGKPYVAARASNVTDELIDVKISSPLGERTFRSVAPDSSAYQSFAARSRTGELTVTVAASSADGLRQEHDATVTVPACG